MGASAAWSTSLASDCDCVGPQEEVGPKEDTAAGEPGSLALASLFAGAATRTPDGVVSMLGKCTFSFTTGGWLTIGDELWET